eukprot:gene1639-1981_t
MGHHEIQFTITTTTASSSSHKPLVLHGHPKAAEAALLKKSKKSDLTWRSFVAAALAAQQRQPVGPGMLEVQQRRKEGRGAGLSEIVEGEAQTPEA